ncbi:hypothetical protein ACQP2K_27000 [Microbispora siamensis]
MTLSFAKGCTRHPAGIGKSPPAALAVLALRATAAWAVPGPATEASGGSSRCFTVPRRTRGYQR